MFFFHAKRSALLCGPSLVLFLQVGTTGSRNCGRRAAETAAETFEGEGHLRGGLVAGWVPFLFYILCISKLKIEQGFVWGWIIFMGMFHDVHCTGLTLSTWGNVPSTGDDGRLSDADLEPEAEIQGWLTVLSCPGEPGRQQWCATHHRHPVAMVGFLMVLEVPCHSHQENIGWDRRLFWILRCSQGKCKVPSLFRCTCLDSR